MAQGSGKLCTSCSCVPSLLLTVPLLVLTPIAYQTSPFPSTPMHNELRQLFIVAPTADIASFAPTTTLPILKLAHSPTYSSPLPDHIDTALRLRPLKEPQDPYTSKPRRITLLVGADAAGNFLP